MKNEKEYAIGIILGVALLWLFYCSLPTNIQPACDNCEVCPTCIDIGEGCYGICEDRNMVCVYLPEGGCGCQELA